MPRIGRLYRIQTLPSPPVMEAACAKICNRAELADRRRFEAATPNREPSEWAIGRFPRTQPAGIVARSAAFGMAERRERKATGDIRASGPPGAAAAPRVGAVAGKGAERRAGAAAVVEAATAAVVVVAAAGAAAGIDRSGREPWQKSTLGT